MLSTRSVDRAARRGPSITTPGTQIGHYGRGERKPVSKPDNKPSPDGLKATTDALIARLRQQLSSGPRPDLVERCSPFLPEGAEIQHAFIAQAAPSFAFFIVTYLTGLTMRWIKYRCVAVTHDAIYVLDSTKLSGGGKPRALAGTMPRHTQLGPVSGRWAEIQLLGERHWVHKRFHDQVTAADTDAGFNASS